MSVQPVINQHLRAMTVEVCSYDDRALQGTAVLLTPDGFLATCAHVVRDCGVDPRAIGEGLVAVRLPATRVDFEDWRDAEVAWCPPDADDDLVLLQIMTDERDFLVPPDRAAVFGSADQSDSNPFRSYGFRIRGDYRGLFANGSIVSHVPGSGRLLSEPLQLASAALDSGMSGAAVLDINRNLVVGFVRQVYDPAAESSKDPDLAWAVDADLLRYSPLADRLRDAHLPRRAAVTPELESQLVGGGRSGNAPVEDQTRDGTPTELPSALRPPDALTPFVGRAEALATLGDVLGLRSVAVLGVIAEAGMGKTALVREWIDRLNVSGDTPAHAFWWTMQADGHDVDDFFRAFIDEASRGSLLPTAAPSTEARANLAAWLFNSGTYVVVLDGLDAAQEPHGDLAGSIKSPALLMFLRAVAAQETASICVLTSRQQVVDLLHFETYSALPLRPLDTPDAIELLRAAGVEGFDAVLAELVRDTGGHPLLLAATAALISYAEPAISVQDALAAAPADASLLVRLRAIGNRAEGHRASEERAVLMVLAHLRLPIRPANLTRIVATTFGFEPSHVAAAISTLSETAACRLGTDGALGPHPTLRRLYEVRARLLSPALLRKLHEECSDHYFRLLEATGS